MSSDCAQLRGWTLFPRWSYTSTTSSKINSWPRCTIVDTHFSSQVSAGVGTCHVDTGGSWRTPQPSEDASRSPLQAGCDSHAYYMKLWLFIIVRPYSIVPRTLSCYAVNHSLEACEGFVAPVSWILVRQTVEMRCTNFSVGSPGQSLGSETSTIYQGATPADCSTVVRKSSRAIGKEIYISMDPVTQA